jgi:chitodextrinase
VGGTGSGEQEARTSTRAPAKWSVFVYVDGDNNLEKFAIEDVNEMEKIGSTEDVNIVIQIDRVTGFNKSNGDWTDTRRYYITQDDTDVEIKSTLLDDTLGELNMADPLTLKQFLEWGITNYPAEKYLIVMWDHGRGIFRSSGTNSGLFKGFNEDLTSNTQEMKLWELDDLMLELKELNGGENFDILGFDQCWLGNIETAYELMDSVDYLVASSDEEPDKGWNYEFPLKTLTQNPDISPRDFAIQITDDYIREYENKTSYDYMTQATVDLAEVNNTFVPLVNEFSLKLMENFYQYKDKLLDLRQQLKNYYYPCPDFYYFVELVEANVSLPDDLRNAARNLIDNYSKVIIAEGHGESHPNGKGLAIYFPDSLDYNQYSKWQAEYDSNIDFAREGWIEFIKLFYNPVRITHEPLRDTEDTVNPYLINADVQGYKLDPESVKVHYNYTGGYFQSLNLTQVDTGTMYTAEIPVQPAGTDIYYYLEVEDESGNKIYMPDSAPELELDKLYHFYVGKDTRPPDLSHIPIGNKIFSKDDFEISVTVTDNIGVDPLNVLLFYKTSSEKDFIELQMQQVSKGGTVYRTFIPSQLIGTTIEYYFSAVDVVEEPNSARLPDSGIYKFKILGLIMNIGRDRYHTDVSGEYDKLYDLLMAPGYNVSNIDKLIDKQRLEDIDLLTITEPEKSFTTGEISVIGDFLSAGGRLLIIGGTDAKVMNSLTQFAGISWSHNSEGMGYSGMFSDHPAIFEGVHELYYTEPGLSIEPGDSATTILVENDLSTSKLAVCSYLNQGKIFAITTGFFGDDTIEMSYNTKFLNNLAMWLVKYPIAVPMGPKTSLNGDPITNLNLFDLDIEEDDFVGFDGNLSVNPVWQTTKLNFTWDFGNGISAFGPQPAYRFENRGNYNVTLTVRTYDGYTDSSTIAVSVKNIIPTAYPGYTSIDGLTVYFNASATKDSASDMSLLTYQWDFGDGNTGTGIAPVHTFSHEGEFHIKLTVTDDNGAVSERIMILDFDDSKDRSIGNYLPSIIAVIIVILIIVLYWFTTRKKPGDVPAEPKAGDEAGRVNGRIPPPRIPSSRPPIRGPPP